MICVITSPEGRITPGRCKSLKELGVTTVTSVTTRIRADGGGQRRTYTAKQYRGLFLIYGDTGDSGDKACFQGINRHQQVTMSPGVRTIDRSKLRRIEAT